jgi:hypothetical protein
MSKDRFFKVYSNLPEDVRKEVIIVINEKPYSWNAVFTEISVETDLGGAMIEKLAKMELI